ncbi:MAG: glycosyltransferase [Coleofasciculus sp. G1-WW12-02]|uniref:glycosyltransferase n=1 Tax=Coleofasciculus sp. G1-WW12-02 TaxID=3068483 RepID=UPI0033005146
MKIAFLSALNSIHTVRWVNTFAERGHEVHLITQHAMEEPVNNDVCIYQLPFKARYGYLLNVPTVKEILENIAPDVLNVHYASGYGTLGRLSHFHPLVLSVWGSDVYDFPVKSPFHHALIASNLRSADWVCSTSEVMAQQVMHICPDTKNISVTPFGIDVLKFQQNSASKNKETITIGTVKKLERKYGIDILIRAFAKVKKVLESTLPNVAPRLRLLIVGGGSQQNTLNSLVDKLGLQNITTFTGFVSHDQVPHYLNQLDIYVAVSRMESFGVAILEASACSLPVVVSNVGGLPEVVQDGETGYVVDRENPDATAEALIKIIQNNSLRRQMGDAGRKLVLEKYQWSNNVLIMEEIYYRVLKKT